MASSLTSPGLIKAINDCLVKATPELNTLRTIAAYDFSDQVGDWGQVVKIPLAGAGTISAFNTTSNDYETPDGTVTYADVTLSVQPKSTFEFDGNDLLEAPNAPYWNKCAQAAADGVKGFISKSMGGLFLSSVCTLSASLSSVTKANIAKLRQSAPCRVADCVLGLAPQYYSELLALFDAAQLGDGGTAIRDGFIGNLYGFKAVVQLNDLTEEAPKGVIIGKNGVACASRAVKVGDPSAYSEVGTVTDEFGMPLTVLRHGSAAKGKGFLNITTLYGIKVINPSMVVRLV